MYVPYRTDDCVQKHFREYVHECATLNNQNTVVV